MKRAYGNDRLHLELLETRIQPGDMLFTGLSGSMWGSQPEEFSYSSEETDDLTSSAGLFSVEGAKELVEFLPASELTLVQAPPTPTAGTAAAGPGSDSGLQLAIVAGSRISGGGGLVGTPLEATPITSAEVVSTVQATPLPATLLRPLRAQSVHGPGAEDATLVFATGTDDLGLANGVAVNAAGESFVAGSYFPGDGDDTNGFIFKLSAAGDEILCGLEFGDGGLNGATGVSVVGDSVFVSGYVDPNDATFTFSALALRMNGADCSEPTGILLGGDGLTVSGYGIAGLETGQAILVGQTLGGANAAGLMARISADFASVDYGVNVVFNQSDTGIFGVYASGDGFHYGAGYLTQPDGTKPLLYKVADPLPDPFAVAWGRFYNTPLNGFGFDIVADATGAYMTGIYNDTASQLLAKHDLETGNQIYGFGYGEEGGFIGAYGIDVDAAGSAYTSGYLFDAENNLDAAILKFAPTGDSVVDGLLLGVEGGVAVGSGIDYRPAENAAYLSGYSSPDFSFFSPLMAKADSFL